MNNCSFPTYLTMAIFCLSIGVSAQGTATLTSAPTVVQTASKVIDAWHLAAADADFDQYFSLMTKKVFLWVQMLVNIGKIRRLSPFQSPILMRARPGLLLP